MADNRVRINKKSFISSNASKGLKYNEDQGGLALNKMSNKLSGVYWIGGSPCCGKSTIAEMLVEEFGFELYKCDDYLDRYANIGYEQGIRIMKKVKSMSIDLTWLRDIEEQVDDVFEFYRKALSIIIGDLNYNFKGKNVLVEGAAIIPEFIKNLDIDSNKYICVVPTREFQIDKYSKREWMYDYLSGCSDPARAFQNWMERDARYAEIVRQSAIDYRMNLLVVDGSNSIEDNYVNIKRTFKLV